MDYGAHDLRHAYRQLGVERGRVVLVRSDLRLLGLFDAPDQREAVRHHVQTLCDLVDLSEGTLVVPTASLGLCNTSVPFDPDATPSEMGVLSEFIRRMPGAVRSFHPFVSYSAVGRQAEEICREVSRHAFGLETPKARMLERDALCLSVGCQPRFTATTVHHAELCMGVPYRYVKEFEHPVMRDGLPRKELFYLYVWYRQCDMERDFNQKIFAAYAERAANLRQTALGRGKAWSYPMREFFHSAVRSLKDDIYAWLQAPPTVRPYRD
ncbi:aminoglycoside N(3)-acetyltransferase [Fundidesulfovibrio butyratiphilus]